MNHKKRRGTAIIESPDGVMLVRMKNDKFMLPGGQSNKGEPRIITAIRELQEETGLIANHVVYLFDFESRFYRQKVFYIQPENGVPAPSNEIVEIGYYPNIVDEKIHESSLQMLRYYGAKYRCGVPTLPRLTKNNFHYLMSSSFHFKPLNETVIEVPQDIKELRHQLQLISDYNRRYRMDDCASLVPLVSDFVQFAQSEGTEIWLAMAFTIKELYALSDEDFVLLMK